MKEFLGQDFLLDNETAKHLYHDFAEDMPIIDYHCHLSPQEIYEDVRYENMTQLWLGGDHYKWRQMRSNGVPEEYVTGGAPDREKFRKWAETLEMAIGNPLYHWSHLELKNYFGYDGCLRADTAEEVWQLTEARLRESGMSARGLIRQSNVTALCTTDDPADNLIWHRKLREEQEAGARAASGFATRVLPAWRPDNALAIEKDSFGAYIGKLSEAAGEEIRSFASLKDALQRRMDFFAANGCCVSDHGLPAVPYAPASPEAVEEIFGRGLRGENGSLTGREVQAYQYALLLFLGGEYARRGWAMQLHFGVQRNLNTKLFRRFGPDAGTDAVGDACSYVGLGRFLDALDEKDALPKTILYSLNRGDNEAIGTIIGCFQDGSAAGKLQHGAAWWFNDHKEGMAEQMVSLANLGLLGNFIGMLTDSRSFLSYARHEYFRRIFCNLVGTWVENGEYPDDEAALGRIVRGVCYENAARYFGLTDLTG